MSPELLPSIPALRRITQSLAMLDAILSPEWEYRYYSFNSRWGAGEAMASMRNGSGDDWFLLFDSAGAAIKGFAHELAGSALPAQIQQQVPKSFSSFLEEPAFSMEQATFCYWRETDQTAWQKVDSSEDDDGSSEMLDALVSGAPGYKAWAEQYYEVPVPLGAVEAMFSHHTLTDSLILMLNPDADLNAAYSEADEIGYPHIRN